MKVYIRNVWPGKKKVKVEYQSSIPPRDSSFWAIIVLTGVAGLVMFLVLLKGSYTPSMTRWWREQAQKEEAGKTYTVSPKGPQSPAELAGLKIPYPKVGNYFQLGFDTLSGFPSGKPPLDGPGTGTSSKAEALLLKVPSNIRILDGQKISVVGFMIPMTVEKNNARTFILAQSRATCCYGAIPNLNQWIYVDMDRGKSAEAIMDVPVTVFGTLKVGTQFDERSTGWCLYRMTSDKVAWPRKAWF